MIHHKSQKINHPLLEPEADNYLTIKLALQFFSIMVLIYLAEMFS